MERTALVPNNHVVPGMKPGVFVMDVGGGAEPPAIVAAMERVTTMPAGTEAMLTAMGIQRASVQRHSPSKPATATLWNGESTYNPATRMGFLNAGGRR
ncbi:hypothetical protein WME90_03100 [Sorangium sp. So ce375]|uniref:hypothetical protein n=1 Tax=Sorangium sp. So ce375 TaxID=3133306 RepID=UPI003F5BEC27